MKNYTLILALCFFWSGIFAQQPALTVQNGHKGYVTNVEISPDGQILASQDYKTVKLWDMRSGKLIRNIEKKIASGSKSNHTFFFHPNSKTIYAYSGNSIQGWEVHTGNRSKGEYYSPASAISIEAGLRAIKYASGFKVENLGKENVIDREFVSIDTTRKSEALTLSRNGKWIAISYLKNKTKRTVEIWDIQKREKYTTFDYEAGKDKKGIERLEFSRDSKYLVGSTQSTDIYVWEMFSKREVLHKTIHGKDAKDRFSKLHVEFLPNNKMLAVLNHQLSFLSLRTKQFSKPIHLPDRGRDITFDPAGETFALSLGEKGIQVYNRNNLNIKWEIGTLTAPISAKAISKDNRYLAIANKGDFSVKIWNLETGSLIWKLQTNNQRVTSLSFSSVGHLLAVGRGGYYDGNSLAVSSIGIEIWDVDKGEKINTFSEGGYSVVQFHPTQPYVASGGYKQEIYIWHAKTGRILHKLEGHAKRKGGLSSLVFSPDGKYLVSGCKEVKDFVGRSLLCWSVETGELVHDFGKLKRDVHAVEFTADGRTVYVSRGSGIDAYDIESGNRAAKVKRTLGIKYKTIALSPDGESIATVFYNGTTTIPHFHLRDLETGKEKRTFRGHSRQIEAMSFMKNGKILVTGSLDHSLRFWNVEKGQEAMSLMIFDEGRAWVAIDSAGRFDANQAGMEYLHYANGTEIIKLSQLMERFYEPGLIAKHIGQRIEPLRMVTELKADDLGPNVALSLAGNTLNIELSPRNGGLGRVALYLNHKEIVTDLNPDRKHQFGVKLTDYAKYFVPGTKTEVGVVAFDREDWFESSLQMVDYTLPLMSKGEGKTPSTVTLNSDKPRLFALCIGTSNYNGEHFDLRFSDDDAHKFGGMLENTGQALFGIDQAVEVKVLTTQSPKDSWPSKANIRKAMEDFAKRAKASDVFVLYLSGHGNTSDKDGKDYFYYLTHDMSSGNLDDAQVRAQYAISTAEFTEWLNRIPAQKQVMVLDACASGKFNESAKDLLASRNIPASQIRALDRLRSRTGLFIISGSTADQVSYEASPFGQGLLTYSLLLGIQSGEALQDGQYVDVLQLFNYAKERVPHLANQIGGIQEPMILMPYGSESYAIGRATPDVQERIQLAEEKPFFSRVRLTNEATFDDDLGLEGITHEQMRDFSAKGGSAPFIFINVKKDPNAYRIVGRYTVEGEEVRIRADVWKGKEVIVQEFEIKEQKNSISILTKDMIKYAYEMIEEKRSF